MLGVIQRHALAKQQLGQLVHHLAITKSKLSDYGIEEKREVRPAKISTSRKTYTPKPVTPAHVWREKFGHATPKVIAHQPLRDRVRALRDNHADEKQVEAVMRQAMQDVFDAAGLVCKSNDKQQEYWRLLIANIPNFFTWESDDD
ncbi:MAG: hypothetical protein EBV86_15095 [Marivivens sp.]|nr:hypothetical protein [Marivivens sp.]